MSAATTWTDWSCRVRVSLVRGTAVDLAVAERLVRSLMDDVAVAVDRFRPDSDLSRVNARAGALVPVRPLTLRLVEVALDAARTTEGAVDPTIGAHLLAAGYDDDLVAVRARDLQAGPSYVDGVAPAGWRRVALDHALVRVGVPRGVRLDLGATAKAWTADEAARRVAARLDRPVLVEIGGDLAVAGHPGRPWLVEVAETAGAPAALVDLTHGGLATSSVLSRRWTAAGAEQHHVLDPRTGRPTDGAVRTATVWAPTALAANTWSTAALVWGTDAGARLARHGVDARLVDADAQVRTLGAWPEDARAVA